MSKNNTILLKFIGLFLLFVYFASYAWISFLFLLGEVYAPVQNNIVSFNLMVILFCVSVIFLAIFKAKGNAFMQILAQDIIILVLGVPLVSTLFDVLKIGLDDQGNPIFAIIGILLITIALMTFNDWKKLKKQA